MLIFSSAFHIFTLAGEVTTEKLEICILELILQGNCSLACTLLDDRCFSVTVEQGALAKY